MERDLKPVAEVLGTELDKDTIQRKLGAMGLYTCEFDEYDNPDEPTNIFRGLE